MPRAMSPRRAPQTRNTLRCNKASIMKCLLLENRQPIGLPGLLMDLSLPNRIRVSFCEPYLNYLFSRGSLGDPVIVVCKWNTSFKQWNWIMDNGNESSTMESLY